MVTWAIRLVASLGAASLSAFFTSGAAAPMRDDTASTRQARPRARPPASSNFRFIGETPLIGSGKTGTRTSCSRDAPAERSGSPKRSAGASRLNNVFLRHLHHPHVLTDRRPQGLTARADGQHGHA